MVKIKLNEDKTGFDTLPPGTKDGWYIDGLLKQNLDGVQKFLKKDWDYLFIVDGIEGGGKSIFAQQAAYYVSNGKLDVENICFTPDEFKEQIIKAPKFGAVIFDEAFRGLSSRASMTETNKILISLLQEIRQKNLVVFVVLPSIWDLDTYVRHHRMRGCFHVHTDANKARGFFKFYKKEKLTHMWANPQKWKYKYPRSPSFKGRFYKGGHPIDEMEYKEKKSKSLGSYLYEKKEKDIGLSTKLLRERTTDLLNLLDHLKEYKIYTLKQSAKIIGRNISTIRNWRNEPAE